MEIVHIEKTSAGYILTITKRCSKCWTNSPTCFRTCFRNLSNIQVAATSTSLDMTTVFHARQYVTFIEIKSNSRGKKLHKMSQGSNFLGGSFGNGGNLKAPILIPQCLEEKDSLSIFKDYFSVKTPIHFHINGTRVFKLVKRNRLSFSSFEIKKCLVRQIPGQKPTLVIVTNQMSDHA